MGPTVSGIPGERDPRKTGKLTIPYQLIGTIIALGIMAYAFYEAETTGRWVILVLAAATLIVPKIFPSSTVGLLCFIARILIAIACYIYLKIRLT